MSADSPLISYDPSAAFLERTGISPAALSALEPALSAAREEMLGVDLRLYEGGGDIPPEKDPLDAGFFELPERILKEQAEQGGASELGRILQTAERLRGEVARVVLLGIGGSYMGARALMEACCHPLYNDLPADRRGGPQLYFEGNNLDNDSAWALHDLLGDADDWAIVVISKSGGTLETAVALRTFLDHLSKSVGGDAEKLAQRVVPVTGKEGSKLLALAQALGCGEIFEVPDGVGGRFSVFSPVGLLPAAIVGIDVAKLLEGAAAMNQHFREAPPEQNVVLQYTGVCHLMATRREMPLRLLSMWSNRLESVGLWYDQLLAESLGKDEQGATPLTTVNTRDLHSRAQQHQEGRRDKMITNVILDDVSYDRIPVEQSEHDQDGLNRLAGKTMPEILAAAIDGTNQAYREDARPTADLHLPALNEHTLGQLLQMLMIATVVEGRMLGINPYGQPGVEMYKKFMKQNLEG